MKIFMMILLMSSFTHLQADDTESAVKIVKVVTLKNYYPFVF